MTDYRPCRMEEDYANRTGGFNVVKQFPSKQNTVAMVRLPPGDDRGELAVVKWFSTAPERMATEIRLLRGLAERGVTVPRLLAVGAGYIMLEYIDGLTLLDLFLSPESQETQIPRITPAVQEAIDGLVTWLQGFYPAAQAIVGEDTIYGDIHCRNFIWRGRIYGLDFSDCRPGCPAEDAGRLVAFALTYDPAFTPYKSALAGELLNRLTEGLGLDRVAVRQAVREEINTLAVRRGMTLTVRVESLML